MLRAVTPTSGGAAWESIGQISHIEWVVELIARSEEPTSVAVKAAYMTAAETGNQHSVHHFTADDAGKLGGQRLPGIAVGATTGRRR